MKNKIKKWFFKTCPKSGRIVGINKKNVVLKICFPLLGLAALVWFLIRVVPKPSRMEYPCQQVAAPIALSFVAFISSTLVGGNVETRPEFMECPACNFRFIRIANRCACIGDLICDVCR